MWPKLALALVAFVLGLAAAEVGHRGWLASRGRAYDAEVTGLTISRFLSPEAPVAEVGGRRITDQKSIDAPALHPFTGSEGLFDPHGVLAYFGAGVPAHEYTIVVVGGSVAEEMMASVGADFAAAIGRDPRFAGRTVRALNYAHWGYKEPQQLARILYLFALGFRPDAVINLDGYNEICLAKGNSISGTHPAFPTFELWSFRVRDAQSEDREQVDLMLALWRERSASKAFLRETLRCGLERSSLWGTFALGRMRASALRCADMQTELKQRVSLRRRSTQLYRQRAGPEFARDDAAALALAVTVWYESSLSLHAACRASAVSYLHVLQPTLYDRGPALTANERALIRPDGGNGPALAQGYPRLYERSRDLVQAGVDFDDARGVFTGIERDLYYDECHVVQAGSRILAAEIARAFLATLPERLDAPGAPPR